MDKTIIGKVRTDCGQDFILGDDGYFDKIRDVLKEFNDKRVEITIKTLKEYCCSQYEYNVGGDKRKFIYRDMFGNNVEIKYCPWCGKEINNGLL